MRSEYATEAVPGSTSEAGDWFFRHSRLGRLISRIQMEEYRPTAFPTRSYYTTIWGFGFFLGVLCFFFATYAPWWPDWLHYWPSWLCILIIMYISTQYFIVNYLIKSAKKLRPGILEVFTCTDTRVNIQPCLYQTRPTDDHPKGEVGILYYQMRLLGGLNFIGEWPPGRYVLISRVLQTEVEDKASMEYMETGKMPRLVLDRPLSWGEQFGNQEDVPADLEYYVLGNPYEDGLEPEFREWINRTYESLSPRTIVMLGRDTLPTRKDFLQSFSWVVRRSGHDWALEDAQRQIADLRRELKRATSHEEDLASMRSGYVPQFALPPGGGNP